MNFNCVEGIDGLACFYCSSLCMNVELAFLLLLYFIFNRQMINFKFLCWIT